MMRPMVDMLAVGACSRRRWGRCLSRLCYERQYPGTAMIGRTSHLQRSQERTALELFQRQMDGCFVQSSIDAYKIFWRSWV